MAQGPGVKTWSLCYGRANGKTPPICINLGSTGSLTIYPLVTATVSNALPIGTQPTAINGVTFHGDAPRVQIQIANAVPGGTTWIAVYPGSTVQPASASIPAVGNR